MTPLTFVWVLGAVGLCCFWLGCGICSSSPATVIFKVSLKCHLFFGHWATGRAARGPKKQFEAKPTMRNPSLVKRTPATTTVDVGQVSVVVRAILFEEIHFFLKVNYRISIIIRIEYARSYSESYFFGNVET